jgi:hypothetical protein
MTQVTFDANMLSKIGNLRDLVEIRDEAGRIVGYFHPILRSTVSTPFSREELERRRQQRSGRPLADVLKDLPRS